jgi:predicted RNA-binding Zn-ribbon protein involved in translation (DUF1610 family)
MSELRAQLPERCPKCGHDPTGDDYEFVSGGGWAHALYVDDGVQFEEFSCPHCGEVVAQTSNRPEGLRR